jgi:hypothetical protein
MPQHKPTDLGMNRTGIALSPVASKKLIDAALEAQPSSTGNGDQLAEMRTEYIHEGAAVGTMPIPASMKGAAATAIEMFKGKKPTVFLDKLGERLAFERAGARLYELLISKAESLTGVPRQAIERMQQFMSEEIEHFGLINNVISDFGADPTAVTPCADVTAVASMGLVQVLSDPRTTLAQSLNALLIAERADNDGWAMLIELASAAGQQKYIEHFQRCLVEEEEHLHFVRKLLLQLTLAELEGKPAS